MPYIPNTPEDQQAMLQAIGAESLDELFAMVPAEVRLDQELNQPTGATNQDPTVKKMNEDEKRKVDTKGK